MFKGHNPTTFTQFDFENPISSPPTMKCLCALAPPKTLQPFLDQKIKPFTYFPEHNTVCSKGPPSWESLGYLKLDLGNPNGWCATLNSRIEFKKRQFLLLSIDMSLEGMSLHISEVMMFRMQGTGLISGIPPVCDKLLVSF